LKKNRRKSLAPADRKYKKKLLAVKDRAHALRAGKKRKKTFPFQNLDFFLHIFGSNPGSPLTVKAHFATYIHGAV
jgi:hypothetical protein